MLKYWDTEENGFGGLQDYEIQKMNQRTVTIDGEEKMLYYKEGIFCLMPLPPLTNWAYGHFGLFISECVKLYREEVKREEEEGESLYSDDYVYRAECGFCE